MNFLTAAPSYPESKNKMMSAGGEGVTVGGKWDASAEEEEEEE